MSCVIGPRSRTPQLGEGSVGTAVSMVHFARQQSEYQTFGLLDLVFLRVKASAAAKDGVSDRFVTRFTTQEWESRIRMARGERLEKLVLKDARRKEYSLKEAVALEVARQNDRLNFMHSMLAELARYENAALERLDEELESVER